MTKYFVETYSDFALEGFTFTTDEQTAWDTYNTQARLSGGFITKVVLLRDGVAIATCYCGA